MKHDSRKGRSPLFQDRGERLLMDEDVSMVPGSDDWGDEPSAPGAPDPRSDRAARIARRSQARAGVFDEGYSERGALPSSEQQQRAFFERMASDRPAEGDLGERDWSAPAAPEPPRPAPRSTGPIASDDMGPALDNPLFFPPSNPDPSDVPEPVTAREARAASDPLASFASGDGGPAHLFDPPTDPFAATPPVIRAEVPPEKPVDDFFGADLEFNSAAEDADRGDEDLADRSDLTDRPVRPPVSRPARQFSGLTITALVALVVALGALVVVQLRQGGPGQGVQTLAGSMAQQTAPATEPSSESVPAVELAAPAAAVEPVVEPVVEAPAEPVAPVTPQGRLVVLTNKPAAIYVDGKHIGTTPIRPIDLDVGAHQVRLAPVDHRGRAWRQDFRIDAGRGTQISHDW